MAEGALLVQTDDIGPTSYGLECLVVIGRRYGLALSVSHMVKDNKLPSAMLDMDGLQAVAERAGFRCRQVRADWSTLMSMRSALPAIVRMTDGSHGVLLRVDGEDGRPTALLQRPQAPGETPDLLDRAAFEEQWSGDVLLIKRSLGLAEKQSPFGAAAVWSALSSHRGLMREFALSTAVLSLLGLAPVIFAQVLLTQVLSYPALGTFLFLCLGFLLLVLFEAGFTTLRQAVAGRLTGRLEHDLSGSAFERLLRQPIDVFERTSVGLIANRLAGIATIAGTLGGRLTRLVLDVGVAVVALPVLMYDSIALAAVAAGFAALLVGWVVFSAGKLRVQAAAVRACEADRSAFISETVGAFSTVKLLSIEARQKQRWDVLTARVTRLRLAEARVANLLQTVVTPLESLMVFGTFAAGILISAKSLVRIEPGILFAVLLLTQRLAAPLVQVATLVREWYGLGDAVASVATLMNEPTEAGHAGEGVRLPIRGRIEFNNVTFSYPDTATPALRSVSFDVPVGSMLGIMGRSGSGKTTITRLLLKLHANYQGLIKIDGIDARDYDLAHLRSSLGIVLQDTFLFSGTIRDNIGITRPDASDEEIAHAARMAGADAFIDRLPLGYATVLEEGGTNVSDGERQRIAIARAVVAQPRMLILDEATSALDPESEAIVNANLRRFASGRTIISISHRFSALAGADNILVLDAGEVQDIGQHDELLERCDVYSGLWQRQKRLLDGPTQPDILLPRGSHVA